MLLKMFVCFLHCGGQADHFPRTVPGSRVIDRFYGVGRKPPGKHFPLSYVGKVMNSGGDNENQGSTANAGVQRQPRTKMTSNRSQCLNNPLMPPRKGI